jgi:cytochrome c-type biogenesis protein CcmH
MNVNFFFITFALCFIFSQPILAVEPDEILVNQNLENRAREISKNIRCVVCQNEPIDSSNSGVARDLRILIRERLLNGDTNDQVYNFLVERYGEFVLFKPRFKPSTYLLWFMPFLLFMFGLLITVKVLKKSSKTSAPEGVLFTREEILEIERNINNRDGGN